MTNLKCRSTLASSETISKNTSYDMSTWSERTATEHTESPDQICNDGREDWDDLLTFAHVSGRNQWRPSERDLH